MSTLLYPEDSLTIGQNAADIAAQALENLGREMIRQKAQSIARQIKIYMECKQHDSIEAVKADPILAGIAVQPVGITGYTALHDTNGINIFHLMPVVIGVDLCQRPDRTVQFKEIITRSLTADADGYYDWQDETGQSRSKYMYCSLIRPKLLAPLGLVVAATTFIDEFLQPSLEIRKKITTLAERVDAYTAAEHRRNEQLRSVNEISRRISSFLSIDELLLYVVDALQATFQYDCVGIYLQKPEQTGPELHAQAGYSATCPEDGPAAKINSKIIDWVAATGQSYRSGDMANNPGGVWNLDPDSPYSHLAVPIQIGSQVLGVLVIGCRKPKTITEVDLFIIQPLADQLAIALENARLYVELREMAIIAERNRIAREIHDTLAQGLAGISMNMQIAMQILQDGDHQQLAHLLTYTRSLAREHLDEARRSVQALHPKVEILGEMDELVRGELDKITANLEMDTNLTVLGDKRPVYSNIKLALLRICQESLTNVKKHACASRVNVTLTFEPDRIEMSILDNGIGFNRAVPGEGSFGLICMSERARLLGGSLMVNSQRGKGTEVFVTVPF